MKTDKTVHAVRTIMFAELKKVMDHGIDNDDYFNSLNQNVFNKATKSGIIYTSRFLKRLYDFDLSQPEFRAFKYFWSNSSEHDRPLLAILYATGNDYLLRESIPVITNTELGKKATVESIEENIENLYLQKYSANTSRSMAQNIASSWKLAGFIIGKVKNIRTQPEISYQVVAFAYLLAYLNGVRGDFILKSNWIKALKISNAKLLLQRHN